MELASLYTVPLSTINGLSRFTKLTMSKGAGTADSIRKFSNRPIAFELNQIGQPIRIQIESRSFAGPYLEVVLEKLWFSDGDSIGNLHNTKMTSIHC